MSDTNKSASQETVSVDKTAQEASKDTTDKPAESKKSNTGGQEDATTAQNVSQSATYSAEHPMPMKFRKNNLFIDVAKANSSKD